MLQINRILHPTDFSRCAKAAFAHAIRLARRFDAQLHVLTVAPSFGEDPIRGAYDMGAGDESIYEETKRKAERMVASLVGEAGAEDVKAVAVQERGVAPAPVIIDYAWEHSSDLIVMGTHGRRGIKRLALGSVTEEVVRRASCSVLTVRSEVEAVPVPSVIERILVPVDFSAFTVPLFRVAKELAGAFGARINLLHVVEPLPFPAPLIGAVTIHDLVPDATQQATEQLMHLMEQVEGPEVTVEAHVEEGHAASVIVDTAQAMSSNLIVIASHGLSGLEGMLLGSITARVVRSAACPVWVARVRPEETPPGPTPNEASSE